MNFVKQSSSERQHHIIMQLISIDINRIELPSKFLAFIPQNLQKNMGCFIKNGFLSLYSKNLVYYWVECTYNSQI